jgi:hypothetical protein
MKSALQALSGGITGVTSAALASGGGVKNAANANALYWGASPSFIRSSSSSSRTRAPFVPPPPCARCHCFSLFVSSRPDGGVCGGVSFVRARGRRAARRDHTGVSTRGREEFISWERRANVDAAYRPSCAGGYLLALWEGGKPTRLDPLSLGTQVGRWSERAVAAVWSVV